LPSFITTPEDAVFTAGGKIFLPCSTSPDTFLGWSKVSGSNGDTTIVEADGRTSTEPDGLVITPAVVTDSATYICNVINSEGNREHRAQVNVVSQPNFKPEDVLLERDVEAFSGGKAAFACIAEGNPRPELSWWKDGAKIVPSERTIIFETNRTYQTGTSLRLKRAQSAEIGRYECRAENDLGSSQMVFNFDLKPPTLPQITIPPENLRVPIDSAVYIRCSATGAPEPIIRWTKNGRKFQISDRFVQTDDFLKIEQTKVADTGYYGCHAYNLAGKHSRRMRLTVWDPRVEREKSRELANARKKPDDNQRLLTALSQSLK